MDSKREQLLRKEEIVRKKNGSLTQKASAIVSKQLTNVMMHLRKVANHPLLMRSIYTDDTLRLMAKDIMREDK